MVKKFKVKVRESGLKRELTVRVYSTILEMVTAVDKLCGTNHKDASMAIGGFAKFDEETNELWVTFNLENLSLGIITHECTHIAEDITKKDWKSYSVNRISQSLPSPPHTLPEWGRSNLYKKSQIKKEMLAYVLQILVCGIVDKIVSTPALSSQLNLWQNYSLRNYPVTQKKLKAALNW